MRICPQCLTETVDAVCPHDGFDTVDKAFFASPNEPAALVGRIVNQRYRVDAWIGSGGMADVYRAEQLGVGRQIALKLIDGRMARDIKAVARFQREARAMAQMVHPNIVAVYDFGALTDGQLFIAMELVGGRSLRQVIAEEAPLHPKRVVRIGARVFDALVEAHAHGLLHRDLKPENIFLCEMGRRRDVVKLLDFGVVKSLSAPARGVLTAPGAIVGSPRYMAPEQARGRGVTSHADMYAAGAILYELLTGNPVFRAATPADYLVAHAVSLPNPPVVDGVALKGPLIDLIMQCLEKKPWDRPETTSDALESMLRCKDRPLAGADGERRAAAQDALRKTDFAIPVVLKHMALPPDEQPLASGPSVAPPLSPSAMDLAGRERAGARVGFETPAQHMPRDNVQLEGLGFPVTNDSQTLPGTGSTNRPRPRHTASRARPRTSSSPGTGHIRRPAPIREPGTIRATNFGPTPVDVETGPGTVSYGGSTPFIMQSPTDEPTLITEALPADASQTKDYAAATQAAHIVDTDDQDTVVGSAEDVAIPVLYHRRSNVSLMAAAALLVLAGVMVFLIAGRVSTRTAAAPTAATGDVDSWVAAAEQPTPTIAAPPIDRPVIDPVPSTPAAAVAMSLARPEPAAPVDPAPAADPVVAAVADAPTDPAAPLALPGAAAPSPAAPTLAPSPPATETPTTPAAPTTAAPATPAPTPTAAPTPAAPTPAAPEPKPTPSPVAATPATALPAPTSTVAEPPRAVRPKPAARPKPRPKRTPKVSARPTPKPTPKPKVTAAPARDPAPVVAAPTPAKRKVLVDSMPPGATVYMGGKSLGTSPIHIVLTGDAGTSVVLKRKGYKDVRYSVPGGARSVRVRMERLATATATP